MNYLGLFTFLIGFSLISCKQQSFNPDKSQKHAEELGANEVAKYKDEIQKLISQVLIWSESEESIDLLPALSDSKDSVYIGFDINMLYENLDKLRQTGFFSKEFIENYNQIIQTLDKKIRGKEFEWFVGELPTFNFASDVNPWCLCQGFSQEQFDGVEIIKIDNNSGELIWKWTKDSDWKDFKFRVIKEGDKWKVSYIEGFDFDESTI